MIVVNTVSVQINDQIVLKSVSCTLTPGHITSFIGKSGAGKTTLLKAICGLVHPSQGTITVNGKNSNELENNHRAKLIGYVFQDFNLFPHLTVLENCIDPLIVSGKPHHEAKDAAFVLLTQLGMTPFINKSPMQLSGGQKQRVAIARALCLRPDVLLLDEPTASLDPENSEILVGILKTLASSSLTIGLCSQDMQFIKKIFDRVYYIESNTIAEFCDDQEQLKFCPLISNFLC